MAAVLKTAMAGDSHRGFESHALRSICTTATLTCLYLGSSRLRPGPVRSHCVPRSTSIWGRIRGKIVKDARVGHAGLILASYRFAARTCHRCGVFVDGFEQVSTRSRAITRDRGSTPPLPTNPSPG